MSKNNSPSPRGVKSPGLGNGTGSPWPSPAIIINTTSGMWKGGQLEAEGKHGPFDWWMPGSSTTAKIGVLAATVAALVLAVLATRLVLKRWRQQRELDDPEILAPSNAVKELFFSRPAKGGGSLHGPSDTNTFSDGTVWLKSETKHAYQVAPVQDTPQVEQAKRSQEMSSSISQQPPGPPPLVPEDSCGTSQAGSSVVLLTHHDKPSDWRDELPSPSEHKCPSIRAKGPRHGPTASCSSQSAATDAGIGLHSLEASGDLAPDGSPASLSTPPQPLIMNPAHMDPYCMAEHMSMQHVLNMMCPGNPAVEQRLHAVLQEALHPAKGGPYGGSPPHSGLALSNTSSGTQGPQGQLGPTNTMLGSSPPVRMHTAGSGQPPNSTLHHPAGHGNSGSASTSAGLAASQRVRSSMARDILTGVRSPRDVAVEISSRASMPVDVSRLHAAGGHYMPGPGSGGVLLRPRAPDGTLLPHPSRALHASRSMVGPGAVDGYGRPASVFLGMPAQSAAAAVIATHQGSTSSSRLQPAGVVTAGSGSHSSRPDNQQPSHHHHAISVDAALDSALRHMSATSPARTSTPGVVSQQGVIAASTPPAAHIAPSSTRDAADSASMKSGVDHVPRALGAFASGPQPGGSSASFTSASTPVTAAALYLQQQQQAAIRHARSTSSTGQTAAAVQAGTAPAPAHAHSYSTNTPAGNSQHNTQSPFQPQQQPPLPDSLAVADAAQGLIGGSSGLPPAHAQDYSFASSAFAADDSPFNDLTTQLSQLSHFQAYIQAAEPLGPKHMLSSSMSSPPLSPTPATNLNQPQPPKGSSQAALAGADIQESELADEVGQLQEVGTTLDELPGPSYIRPEHRLSSGELSSQFSFIYTARQSAAASDLAAAGGPDAAVYQMRLNEVASLTGTPWSRLSSSGSALPPNTADLSTGGAATQLNLNSSYGSSGGGGAVDTWPTGSTPANSAGGGQVQGSQVAVGAGVSAAEKLPVLLEAREAVEAEVEGRSSQGRTSAGEVVTSGAREGGRSSKMKANPLFDA